MDSLQFQKAEFGGVRPKCAACAALIDRTYFHFAGRLICPACADKVSARRARPENSSLARGLIYGGGAAIGCSIGYAVIIAVTHLDLALVAILVGYLVGRAVRIGSQGLTGRRLQIAAVALSYFAITGSRVVLVVSQLAGHGAPMARLVFTIAAVALASPFLDLRDGVGGILGLIIVVVGLAQAWRQTARDSRVLLGPYTLEEGKALA
jgi:hypothetical protein